MSIVWRVATLAVLVLALWRVRWAYGVFVVLALLSLPARTGFHVAPRACELLVRTDVALFSLRNYPHIILFALFFLLSRLQFTGRRATLWALVATIAMGGLIELAEGVSGQGHCRLRDLLPDALGGVLGWLTFEAVRAVGGRMFRSFRQGTALSHDEHL